MRSFMARVLLLTTMLSTASLASAGDVEIVMANATSVNGKWNFDVTLRHQDTGWEHYADAWQIVDEQGKLLGKRVLFHPHEHEQPFTRSLQSVAIPASTSIIYVEAHDKVHGWSKQRVRIDLNSVSGDRYSVKR